MSELSGITVPVEAMERVEVQRDAALARVRALEAALRMYADPERWYTIQDAACPTTPHRAWVCPEPMDEWDYARAALEAQP